uniref:transporter substrate-binding domain-containing protein n=1 Tax=Nocardia noduli TaxID=2815722 RepID=UPI001C2253A3
MKRVRGLLAALAVAALVSGCAGNAPDAPGRSGDYTEPPLPADAVPVLTDMPLPPSPDIPCTDPTASLRPNGSERGATLDAIRARGRLVVGLDAGSNLFSFRDPLTGAIVGFDADIAREVARDLLGSPDLIEYRSLGSAEREGALQNHSVDIVAKTMTITCERRQRVEFSTVYLKAGQRVLAMKNSGIGGLADLAGKRVCVVRGTTSLDRIRREQPAATILTVPTWADCLVVLQQRQRARAADHQVGAAQQRERSGAQAGGAVVQHADHAAGLGVFLEQVGVRHREVPSGVGGRPGGGLGDLAAVEIADQHGEVEAVAVAVGRRQRLHH